MIISIASGKGGTGKTTVATNLALSLESKVQFLDCDVEEPNAHLFIRPTFDHSETVTTPGTEGLGSWLSPAMAAQLPSTTTAVEPRVRVVA